jgi:hypothetical protein
MNYKTDRQQNNDYQLTQSIDCLAKTIARGFKQ